jgi:hypothetical protein
MTPYPAFSEALESAQAAFAIIKAGEVSTRKGELAYHAWIVQGHAQFRLLGNATPNFAASAPPSDEESAIFEKLSGELADQVGVPQTYGGIFDKVDWKKLVALLIKFAPLFLDEA